MPAARTPARWRARVCAWKDCFDVAGLHTTGGAPWRAGAPARERRARPSSQRLEAAGCDHDRQARDDAAGLGDDGPDARAAAVPQPARPGPRPRRIVVGLGRGRRDRDRRSRARHRRRRQRAASGRGLRRRRIQADLRLRPARRVHALRAELRHRRRRSRAPSRRRRCSTRSSRPRRRSTSPAGSAACASPSSAATSRRRSRTTSRRCSSDARERVRASEIDIALVADRQPLDVADLHGGARGVRARARPAARSGRIRPDDARRRRGIPDAARDRLPARPQRARGGAAALRGRGGRLRHPALRLGALPAGADRRTGQDDAHECAHEAVQRAGLAGALAAGRRRPRRPAARPAGRRPPGHRRARAPRRRRARRALLQA